MIFPFPIYVLLPAMLVLLCHLGNIAYRVGRTLNTDPKDGHIQGDDDAAALWRREYREGWEPVV